MSINFIYRIEYVLGSYLENAILHNGLCSEIQTELSGKKTQSDQTESNYKIKVFNGYIITNYVLTLINQGCV